MLELDTPTVPATYGVGPERVMLNCPSRLPEIQFGMLTSVLCNARRDQSCKPAYVRRPSAGTICAAPEASIEPEPAVAWTCFRVIVSFSKVRSPLASVRGTVSNGDTTDAFVILAVPFPTGLPALPVIVACASSRPPSKAYRLVTGLST